MIRKTGEQISTMVDGKISHPQVLGIRIEGVSIDSRTIQQGNLYIPLVRMLNGHDFALDAFQKGAAAALWQMDQEVPDELKEKPLIFVVDTLTAMQQLASQYRNELPVRVVGITGSNGKTTTKDMVASILSTTYRVHKTQGNFNNHYGLPLTLLQLSQDTEIAVLEMGMSGRGEIDLLSRMAAPEAVIVTNIGESHIELLGSRKEIARAKLEILHGLPDGGMFIYNGDEPLIEEVLVESPLLPTLLSYRFGQNNDNDIYPTAMMTEQHATLFTINGEASPSFTIPLLGKHNVINALAAIAISKYMGVVEQDIVRGLKTLKLTSMRMELLHGKSGVTILNDAYNASPTSMKAAIQLLQEMQGYAHKFVVLGDMLELGPQEQNYHKEIGSLLSSEYFDYVFTFGELAEHIALEAESKFVKGRVKSFLDKKELVAELANVISSNDIVLVKGSRGMNLEEVISALN